jgi:hypothetical protein
MQTQDGVITAADEAAEDAAFEAGFAAIAIESAPEPEPVAAAAPEPEKPEPAVAPEPEPSKPLTKDDLEAIIAATKQETRQEMQALHDRVFGKFGELKQKIDAMKSSTGGLSAKAREKLTDQFPELASMLFDDEPEPEPVIPATSTPVQPASSAVTEDNWQADPLKLVEMRLLTRDHSDWKQVVVSQEFNSWRQTALAPADNAKLDEAWDADFVSAKITEFKAWQAAQAKKAADDKKKQERLDAAITPRGNPRAGTSSLDDNDEEAAMEAAFKQR